MKTGRPRRYVSLKKMNVHVEQSTLDMSHKIVEIYNAKHGMQLMTFSIAVRKLLASKAEKVLDHMQKPKISINDFGDQFDPSTWKKD